MAFWLVKSEPFKYSWDQFVMDKLATWDGVRNYAARNNLRSMKKGDLVFYYHSNEGVAIVGIAKVAKESYQDPTTDNEAWLVVDLKPVKKLKTPVSLEAIKAISEYGPGKAGEIIRTNSKRRRMGPRNENGGRKSINQHELSDVYY